jgi:hypothetical protein
VVLRALTSQYPNPQRGQPSNNSNSFLLLGGLDYQSKSVWRYRLLIGVEVREFQSPAFPTRTAPIAEGQLIWQPTELTTVTGSLSRLIEDPQSAGTSGYILTNARVAVDHKQIGSSGTTTINPASITTAAFSQNMVALALHLAL